MSQLENKNMNHYSKPSAISALEAKFEALKISFSPVIFQVTYCLLKLNILKLISEQADNGMTAKEIAEHLNLSLYGIKVLLDVGLSCHLVWLNDEKYVLDKIGHFVLSDSMVQVNLDFVQDVCYQGLFSLMDSIKFGKPEGLKVFGNWKTIYPALSSLPPAAKESWFGFDHYYSDKAFPEVLPIVFAKPIKELYDIGGNTGKFAFQCIAYNTDTHVTIIDLPEQVVNLEKIIGERNLSKRVGTYAANMLDPNAVLPKGADAIWMSQFLDCFSENEILSILKRAADIMDDNTRLYILDLFWDRQTYEAAAFSLNCTSIYFTCMANGNSRMYHSKDLVKLIHEVGLYVDEDIDHIGSGHTLLGCKKKRNSIYCPSQKRLNPNWMVISIKPREKIY